MSYLRNFMMKNNKKLITHNGSFHSDDVFACATLCLMLEKKGEQFDIIRTRDNEIIRTGDYVFDLGNMYDEEKNRFDHHQIGGAGGRENGIEYSSFGLVWKKFGAEICESQKVADMIDNKLVAPVDAFDNGIDLYKNNFGNILPYTVKDVLSVFSPTSLEDMDKDETIFKSACLGERNFKERNKKSR